jgi:hypothetical protein
MPMALSNTDKRETHLNWMNFTGQPLASTVLYHNVRHVQGLTAKVPKEKKNMPDEIVIIFYLPPRQVNAANASY